MKMYYIKFHVFVLSLVLSISFLNFSDSYSQQISTSDSGLNYWVHSGTSVSTLGVGVQGGLSFDYNRHLFSLRTISTDLDYGAETWDIALLYGRGITYRSLYISAGAGASVIGGKKYSQLFGGESTEAETTLGFPLEGQISWTPTGFIALGIYSYANVNTEQPFGGIGLNIRLGDLK